MRLVKTILIVVMIMTTMTLTADPIQLILEGLTDLEMSQKEYKEALTILKKEMTLLTQELPKLGEDLKSYDTKITSLEKEIKRQKIVNAITLISATLIIIGLLFK